MLYAIAMTFGNRLAAARKKIKMTQKQLGDALGVSDAAISGWERGDSAPEIHRLPALLKALKIPADWLIQGSGDPPDQDMIRVLLDALNSSQRRQAVRLLRTLMDDSENAA
jgi:transcriptional regulator with XRE-family HTH domain